MDVALAQVMVTGPFAAADEIKDGVSNHPLPPSHTHIHTAFSGTRRTNLLEPKALDRLTPTATEKNTDRMVFYAASIRGGLRPLFR